MRGIFQNGVCDHRVVSTCMTCFGIGAFHIDTSSRRVYSRVKTTSDFSAPEDDTRLRPVGFPLVLSSRGMVQMVTVRCTPFTHGLPV